MKGVLGLPRSLLVQATRHSRFALDNARQATVSIGLAVAQRTELTRLLTPDQEAEDGADAVQGGEAGTLRLMSPRRCMAMLQTQQVGRFAYIPRAGVPDVVPVNYVVDGGDVLIRSGPGPKLQAAERRELVAFEVDAFDADARTGWSVVIHGMAVRESPTHSAAAGSAVEPWAAGPRNTIIRITPNRVTGRSIS